MPKKQITVKVKKMPSFWNLSVRTFNELTTFWRPLFGVTAIYALLYFILVLGFSISYSYDDIVAVVEELGVTGGWFEKNSIAIANIFSYNTQADATAIVQSLLFLIATLAFIWTLRRVRTLKNIKLRDAYYDGPARIVPFALVSVLLLITFVPAMIGSSILSIAFATNSSGIELFFVGLIGGSLLLASVYWFAAWLPAAYVVSLPKSTPIAAIKAARNLTKGKRFWIARNTLALTLVSLFIGFLIMLLFVSLLSQASIVAAFIVGFVLFAVAQTFMFTLYRSLIDEE